MARLRFFGRRVSWPGLVTWPWAKKNTEHPQLTCNVAAAVLKLAWCCKLENRYCNVTEPTFCKAMQAVAIVATPNKFETASQKRIPAQKTTRTSSSTYALRKKNSTRSRKEKCSLHDVATAVSVETVVQTNLGPFPLERAGSICPDTVFFDFVAYCCKCCKMLQSLIAGCNCRNRNLEQIGQRKIWMISTL